MTLVKNTRQNKDFKLYLKKEKTIDANIEMSEMLKSSEKDFKLVMVKMLQQEITNLPEINKKVKSLNI